MSEEPKLKEYILKRIFTSRFSYENDKKLLLKGPRRVFSFLLGMFNKKNGMF